jgi:hypothetical protein
MKPRSRHRAPDELTDFLSELASHLLLQGIDLVEFQRAAQSAYIQTALRNARMQNSRVNQSAVAAITGLSRLQVRRLLDNTPSKATPRPDRINKVLSAWRSDQDFIDLNGRPRDLAIRVSKSGFSSLAKKYASDVSSPALLAELIRLGLVVKIAGKAHLVDRARSGKRLDAIRALAAGLAHSLKNPDTSSYTEVHVAIGEAEYASPVGSAKVLLNQRIAQGCRALAADIQSAGDSLGTLRSGSKGKSGARTRILVVTME